MFAYAEVQITASGHPAAAGRTLMVASAQTVGLKIAQADQRGMGGWVKVGRASY